MVGDPAQETPAVSLELFFGGFGFDAENEKEPDDDGSNDNITHVARFGVSILSLPAVLLGPR